MYQPPQGVKISAYIFYALAALTLLASCGSLAFFGISLTDSSADASFLALPAAILCVGLLFTAFYAGVGWGLLKLESWARILAIVLAILSLCSFPIGTILGGIVLYFMFQQETVDAFSS